MKKFLKIFLLVPIFLLTVLFSFACGEEGIKSITLSLSDYQIVAGYYNVKMTTTNIDISVKIEPNTISASDLTWESSATDIVTVYNATLKTRGAGTATITASYKNEDGSVIKGTLRIRVNPASEGLSFSADRYETPYTGESLINNYKAIQDNGTTQNYTYTYFNADTRQTVEDIVDVGTYQITCTRTEGGKTESCSTILIVKKATLNISCGSYQITYGDDLPTDIYSKTSLPEGSILANDQAGTSLYGFGRDSEEKIGEYIQVTEAYKGSNVKSYEVTAYFELDENFQNNYDVTTANITKGSLTVLQKNVVLAVNDQTVTYGNDIAGNNFSLYSYKEYTEAGSDISNLTPLDETVINFSKNIYLGSATFMLNGSEAIKNNAGNLNVLIDTENNNYASYELCYNNATTINSNLYLAAKLNGKLTITPREVTILPAEGQTKVYGDEDPSNLKYSVIAGTFISQDTLPNFLQVDYNSDSLGQGNFLAGVNKYFYKVNNDLNKNYKVSLGTLAQEGNNPEENENKIRFEVLKSEIVIKLKNENGNYSTPTSTDAAGEPIHSLSYYNFLQDGTVPNYIAKPESITVNGQEILSNTPGDITQNTISKDFEQDGFIILKTGGTYKFSVSLTPQTTSDYFMSYTTSLASNFFEADENNFIVNFISSNLNLRKLNITIIPNMTTSLVTREYDGSEGESSLPTGFMSDYRVTGELDGNEIEQILVNYTEVLSLLNESSQYTRVDSNGVVNNKTSAIKNVGKYQIYLSKRLTFKTGMEYYNILLDTSTTYYFTITKATALITPQINENGSNQSKIYGDSDPENLKYDYYGVAEDDTEKFAGKLSRVAGENVGDYEITIGDLSLGENYNLLLSSTPVYFSITQREVKVEPISYVTTYGENYPTTIDYYTTIVGEYNDGILVAPTFTGELEIKDATKINGYYPVCVDESGNVLSYLIGKGTLACNSNYTMTFIETSTYKINKRTCVIDIVSQQVENKNGLTTTGLTLGSGYYTISNLLSGTTSTLTIDLNTDKEAFLDVKSYNVSFYMGGTDVSYCYEESLGQKIVYNIDVKIIYLAIVDRVGKLSSTVNVTYNGDYRNNDFALICQTEGYAIDEQASSYSFSYLIGNTSANPKDVGSYVSSIDLSGSGSKIVLKHNCISGVCAEDCSITESIEFTEIDGEIKQNCVLSVSNYGYLNISRANISYLEDKLSFKTPLTYGTDILSDINTTYTNAEGGQVPIFYGVGTDSIDLLLVNSKNYYYSASNYSLSLLDANKTYPIEVTVQAAKNGGLDNNYNPLTISVPLQVVPKNLFVNSYQFNIGTGTEMVPLPDYVTYDGISRPVTIALDISSQSLTDKKYATTYTFVKLKCVYSDSVDAAAECYGYKTDTDTGLGYPAIEEGLLTKPLSEIKSGIIDEIIYLTYDGVQYLVINDYCLLLEQDNVGSPLKAGIYVCIANCEAKTNYIFAENESNPVVTGTSRTYIKIYEIKKSSEVSVDNWKESFFYTTQFDLNNPSSLPFEYDMSPNFKDQVVYTMEEPIEWPSNNMLNVGNYSVTLTVVNDNYYYSNPFTFEVTKLAAEFVFPTTKTYVFKGENIPIVDFLNDIRILEKDKDGNTINSFYYTYGDENPLITLEFYEPFNETALDYIPWDVLESEDDYYTLRAKYGGETSNYYGEGEFKYKIIKKAYMGAVRFQNTTIIYNPSYTAEELYTLIYANMFSIGLEDGFTISIFNENSTDSDNNEIVATDDGWISELLEEGQKTLRLEVEFSDGITADYKATAILTIEKMSVSQTEIVAPQSSTFTYTGYPVYNYLNFNTASLNPETLEVNASESLTEQTNPDKKPNYLQYTSGRYIYTVFKTKEEGNTVELKVKDNLGNVIFTVVYTYQYEDETGAFVPLREINGSTSVSNPSYIYHFPIDPRDTNYRVVYSYTFGDNYAGSAITLTYKNFKINKIPTLYISFSNNTEKEEVNNEWSNWDLPYNSSKTLSSRFAKELLVVKNQSGGSNVSNVKLNVQVNSYVGYQLQRRSGIHLFVYFTDYNGAKQDIIYDANENDENYYMHATIMYARYNNGPNEDGSSSRPYYLISDYAEKVKFGSSPEILASYFNPTFADSDLGIDNPTSINNSRSYSPCLTENVVISKYLYDINNWKEVFGSTNNNIETVQTEGGGIMLKITADSVVSNLTSNVTKITIVKNDGGENRPTGYEITSTGFSFAQFVANAEDYATTNRVYRFILECKKNYTSTPISFIVEKETEESTS